MEAKTKTKPKPAPRPKPRPILAVCSLCGSATGKRLFWRVHNDHGQRFGLYAPCQNGRWFGIWIPVPYLAVMATKGLLTEAAEKARMLWGLK